MESDERHNCPLQGLGAPEMPHPIPWCACTPIVTQRKQLQASPCPSGPHTAQRACPPLPTGLDRVTPPLRTLPWHPPPAPHQAPTVLCQYLPSHPGLCSLASSHPSSSTPRKEATVHTCRTACISPHLIGFFSPCQFCTREPLVLASPPQPALCS